MVGTKGEREAGIRPEIGSTRKVEIPPEGEGQKMHRIIPEEGKALEIDKTFLEEETTKGPVTIQEETPPGAEISPGEETIQGEEIIPERRGAPKLTIIGMNMAREDTVVVEVVVVVEIVESVAMEVTEDAMTRVDFVVYNYIKVAMIFR